MKELKFRAWEGYRMVRFVLGDGYAWSHPSAKDIMQYTGLRDKNGVEIYEGDVLEGHPYIETCQVLYDEGLCSYRCEEIGESKASSHLLDWSGEGDLGYNPFEVIGNIHEPPPVRLE